MITPPPSPNPYIRGKPLSPPPLHKSIRDVKAQGKNTNLHKNMLKRSSKARQIQRGKLQAKPRKEPDMNMIISSMQVSPSSLLIMLETLSFSLFKYNLKQEERDGEGDAIMVGGRMVGGASPGAHREHLLELEIADSYHDFKSYMPWNDLLRCYTDEEQGRISNIAKDEFQMLKKIITDPSIEVLEHIHTYNVSMGRGGKFSHGDFLNLLDSTQGDVEAFFDEERYPDAIQSIFDSIPGEAENYRKMHEAILRKHNIDVLIRDAGVELPNKKVRRQLPGIELEDVVNERILTKCVFDRPIGDEQAYEYALLSSLWDPQSKTVNDFRYTLSECGEPAIHEKKNELHNPDIPVSTDNDIADYWKKVTVRVNEGQSFIFNRSGAFGIPENTVMIPHSGGNPTGFGKVPLGKLIEIIKQDKAHAPGVPDARDNAMREILQDFVTFYQAKHPHKRANKWKKIKFLMFLKRSGDWTQVIQTINIAHSMNRTLRSELQFGFSSGDRLAAAYSMVYQHEQTDNFTEPAAGAAGAGGEEFSNAKPLLYTVFERYGMLFVVSNRDNRKEMVSKIKSVFGDIVQQENITIEQLHQFAVIVDMLNDFGGQLHLSQPEAEELQQYMNSQLDDSGRKTRWVSPLLRNSLPMMNEKSKYWKEFFQDPQVSVLMHIVHKLHALYGLNRRIDDIKRESRVQIATGVIWNKEAIMLYFDNIVQHVKDAIAVSPTQKKYFERLKFVADEYQTKYGSENDNFKSRNQYLYDRIEILKAVTKRLIE